jgi:hypothetical protein
VIGLSYFIYVFLMKRPFNRYQKFWSSDLEVWSTFKNFNIGHKFWMVSDRTFIMVSDRTFICVFLMTKPFYWYHNFWPSDLNLDVWSTCSKLNIVHVCWMASARYGFHMYVPSDLDLFIGTLNCDILTLILSFDDDDHLWNLSYTGAFVFHKSQHILFIL